MACPGQSLNISNTPINSPVCVGDATHVFSVAVTLLLIAAALISFGMILWGGMQYIYSGGDKEGTSKAKAKITYAVVGLAIAFLALALWRILGGVIGFNLFG